MKDDEFKVFQEALLKDFTVQVEQMRTKCYRAGLFYGALGASGAWIVMDLMFGVFG